MPVVTFPTLHRPAGHPEYARRASPGHLPEGRGCANICCCGGAWTFQEDKRFENALAMLPGRVDLSSLRDFVEGIAPEFPGKSVEQVGRHLEALWHDVELIDSGDVMFPEQWTMDEDSEREESKGKSKVQRKRGIAWTKEEHEYDRSSSTVAIHVLFSFPVGGLIWRYLLVKIRNCKISNSNFISLFMASDNSFWALDNLSFMLTFFTEVYQRISRYGYGVQ